MRIIRRKIIMKKYLYDKSENKLSVYSFSPYSREYLDNLIEKYDLKELYKENQPDYEKVLCIAKWVSNLWEHDGSNQPEKYDPDFILNEVINNGKRFRCCEYGIVIDGCLNALNITARTLALKTEDVETREFGAGHVLAEAYLKDINKWIFIDGQWGVIPLLDNIPLNAAEFADCLENREKYGERLSLEILKSDVSEEDYFNWIKEYLYFYDYTYWEKSEDGDLIEKTIMLAPIGVKKPEVFQIKYPLKIDIYTHSVIDFYSANTQ